MQDSLLQMHLHTLVQQLTLGPSTVKCWVDSASSSSSCAPAPQQRVLLAANMHNNEELLPHYIAQLVHVLSLLPLGSAFLSIYESGSTDATGAPRAGLGVHPHALPRPGTLTGPPVQACGCRS